MPLGGSLGKPVIESKQPVALEKKIKNKKTNGKVLDIQPQKRHVLDQKGLHNKRPMYMATK
jgi:hypothetical protein